MTFIVAPTELDVGASPNDGRAITELNWGKIFTPTDIEVARSPLSHVRNGYTVAGTSGLNVDIAPGEAVIGGYTVRSDATETVAVSASTSVNLWLELLFTGSQVSGAQIIEQGTSSQRANSILLAGATTAAGSVSSTVDRRVLTPSYHNGSYVGTGGGIGIQVGFRPYKVEVVGDGPVTDSYHTSSLYNFVNRGFKLISGGAITVVHAPGSGSDIPLITLYGFSVAGNLAGQLSDPLATYYWAAWR